MKKKLLFGVTFLMIVLFCCSTYAAITFKAGLTSNTTSANPGDEISVVMNFNNLNEITTGLNAYEGVLEYDKDVFEPVTTSNFSSLNNWDSISFNESTGHFLSAKNDGITSQEDIVKITLKVKSDSKIGNTTISIKKSSMITTTPPALYTPKPRVRQPIPHCCLYPNTRRLITTQRNMKRACSFIQRACL